MSEGAAPEGRAAPARSRLSLKGRALRLLAQREHSRLELQRKLQEHASSEDELTEALDALQAKGFISDERVADSVVHRRADKLGVRRVRAELQAKGLGDEVIATALESLHATEHERAQAVWARKFGQVAADASERARQMRFLAARGFSAEVVRRIVLGRGGDGDE